MLNPSESSSLLQDLKSDPLNDRNLSYLFEQLENPLGVLPFVGAGLSVPLGFPGWTEFLRKEASRDRSLREGVDQHIDKGEYEEAAELLKSSIGFGDFEDALDSAFGERRLPPSHRFPADAAVMEITKLTTGPAITTNFDRVLERAFEVAGQPFTDRVWGDASDQLTKVILQDRHVLLKMHGDILERRNRVLTLAEYRAHYGDGETIDFKRPLPRLLQRLFESRPLLFVGCSLHHDRTLRVLRDVVNETNSRHYAIVEQPATEEELNVRRLYLSNHGLRCIWFPHEKFESVPVLLKDLADSRTGSASKPVPVATTSAADERPAGRPYHGKLETQIPSPNGDFWKDKAWDHAVHDNLGETLTFFLVRVRPYRRERAVEAINKINHEQGVGSVRAFELLGSVDLLVRAWLPGGTNKRFQQLLSQIPGCKGVYPFSVDEVVHRWYHSPLDLWRARRRTELLKNFDRHYIESVQDGRKPEEYKELLNLNLAFETQPEPEPGITFFEAINFEQTLSMEAMQSACRDLRESLTSSSDFSRISIDQGHGFCQILVKGESPSFFAIGRLPRDISDGFSSYGVITETFLSQSLSYITGEGKIGGATFAALGGRDLFVHGLIPELYPRVGENSDKVELLLKGSPQAHEMRSGGRRFLHDYLLGVLHSVTAEWAMALYRLFGEWEQYLRDNHRAFLGRRRKNPDVLAEAAHIAADKSWKDYTLVDVLEVYSHGLRGSPEESAVVRDWRKFTNVRNAVMHNRTEDLSDWQGIVMTVLEYWKPVTTLIAMVEREIGVAFGGLYREAAQ